MDLPEGPKYSFWLSTTWKDSTIFRILLNEITKLVDFHECLKYFFRLSTTCNKFYKIQNIFEYSNKACGPSWGTWISFYSSQLAKNSKSFGILLNTVTKGGPNLRTPGVRQRTPRTPGGPLFFLLVCGPLHSFSKLFFSCFTAVAQQLDCCCKIKGVRHNKLKCGPLMWLFQYYMITNHPVLYSYIHVPPNIFLFSDYTLICYDIYMIL